MATRRAVLVLLVTISFSPASAEVATEGPAAPAATPVGNAIFPSVIDPKYSEEAPANARLHTCIDQYNRNKATNANGGLRWIEKGGGYFSACSKRLGGVISSNSSLAEVGGERPAPPDAPPATPTGIAVFPTVIDPKYAGEPPARARLRTCIDQFNKNKSANANGGLNWRIEKGTGYYSKCDTLLGGNVVCYSAGAGG